MASLTSEPAEPRRLNVTPSRRGWRITAYVAFLVAMLAVIGWVSTHPKALDTSTTRVQAETPVGEPVYVGVFAAPAGFGRNLHVSGVRVFATSTADVTVTPHICHGGSVSVTTTPETFCREFGPSEGASFEAGDAIVLEVVGDAPGVVDIDRVRVAYRDGLQWATQDAGAPSQVNILAR
ncbi:MAG TPA: hypothetical protein VFI19_09995 [Nocardioides sp.]|nr:hypothetical protein [Nocardioides sp.]